MSVHAIMLFWPLLVCAALLFVIGFYCLLFTYNLIRALIGLELLIKGATLLLVASGYINGRSAFSQAFVITLIVIEVVVIAIASGVVIGLHEHNKSLDTRQLRNLRG